MDIMYLPLAGPFEISAAPVFLRGLAEEGHKWDPPSMQHPGCSSTSTAAVSMMSLPLAISVFVMVVTLIFKPLSIH